MDLWEDLERRIRERGFRVDERLRLLARLRAGESPAADRARLLEAIERAAQVLLREAAR